MQRIPTHACGADILLAAWEPMLAGCSHFLQALRLVLPAIPFACLPCIYRYVLRPSYISRSYLCKTDREL